MEPRRYIAGLDGLRAVAALSVFGVHLGQLTGLSGRVGPFDVARLLENGNTGVCLFFMLSGFLLALPFWFRDGRARRTGDDRPWLLAFGVKRIGRIAPAYYLCLTGLLIIHAMGGKHYSTANIALHYAFLHNFSETAIYDINDPFWTLAVQAQFYVLFPLMIVVVAPLMRKRGAATVVALLLSVGAFWLHARVIGWAESDKPWPLPEGVLGRDGRAIYVSALAHLPHFLLGVALAGIYVMTAPQPREVTRGPGAARPAAAGLRQDGRRHRALIFDALFAAALAGVVVILGVPGIDDALRLPPGAADEAMVGRYNLPYVPVLIGVLILSAPRGGLAKRVLEWAPLRWFGVISFGVYVYHLPCMMAVKKLFEKAGADVSRHWALFAAAGLAASVIVAALSYVLVERPLLRWSKGRRGD